MSTHTPGSWKWWGRKTENRARPVNYDLATLLGPDGKHVVHCYGGEGEKALGKDAESIANARLIAAAPDLLAACEGTTKRLESVLDSRKDLPIAVRHVLTLALEANRAAIAKAVGK